MTRHAGTSRWLATATSLVVALTVVAGGSAAVLAQEDGGPAKVILDTDMVELFDDGMAMLLLDQSPDIDLLGVTVVSGNTPMPRGMATGARQLEALDSTVPIYEGSRYGIRNWRAIPEVLDAEKVVSPVVSWAGYLREGLEGIDTDPMADWREVYEYLYGEAPTYEYVHEAGAPDEDGAEESVEFLLDQANKYPGEITLVVIGPVTNIARAIMADPTFPSKIKQIVYMGGTFYLPGNSSASAEFNWWADPDAAKIAVRQQWGDTSTEAYELYGNQVIAGLEANNNTGGMPPDLYEQMVDGTFPGIQELFLAREAAITERGGTNFAPSNIWDLFAAAYVIDPAIVLSWNDDPRPEDGVPQDIYGVYVDVDSNMGPDFGRSIAYREDVGPVGARKAAIENFIDEDKFWTEIVVPLATGQGE